METAYGKTLRDMASQQWNPLDSAADILQEVLPWERNPRGGRSEKRKR